MVSQSLSGLPRYITLDRTHDIYAVRYHGFFVSSEQCAESVAHAWMLAMVTIGAPDYAARVYVKGEKT